MKTKKITIAILFLLLSLTIMLLVGCSQPATNTDEKSAELNATQAYQTIDAQLTQAVAQTPVPPTATKLSDLPTATASPEQPTATATSSEPTATFLPTFTHTPATRCDQAEAAYPSIDITIPDDTEIPAGNSFTKVWRVVNTGTCNWTAEYTAVFLSGDQMQAPAAVNITEPVAPSQSIDIAVTMVAPDETGSYQGYWMLQNADGENFGIGPNANDSFWVRIVVVEAEDTPTPTASPAPEPDALVNGSASLSADDSVDLDTLQLNTSGSDLRYEQVTDGDTITGHQLVSLSGVSGSIFGASQPTYGQCSTSQMGAVTLDLEDTASGTYICYTTNQGLTGWARFDALDTDNGVVSITVLTWAALE
jgi:hypothetical protein